MTLHRRIRKFFSSPWASRSGQRRPSRLLQLEALEDRTLPTVVFTPQFGVETQARDQGERLELPDVYLIFWGSAWNGANSPLATSFRNAVTKVVSSTYFHEVQQYNFPNPFPGIDPTLSWDSSNPANPFIVNSHGGAIDDVIQNQRDNFQLGEGNNAPSDPIYVCVTQPGVLSATKGALGFNQGEFDVDADGVHNVQEVWVSTRWLGGNAANGLDLDTATWTFGHELAEIMTDPHTDFFSSQSQGYEINPPQGWLNFDGSQGDQIGDNEGASYHYRLTNGALVQSLWSAANNAWVVNDGTSDTVTVTASAGAWSDPGGDIFDLFNGEYDVTINTDQLRIGSTDTLTVGTAQFGPYSDLQITLNNQVFDFPDTPKPPTPGQPWDGSVAHLTINSFFSRDTITINQIPAVSATQITINTSGNVFYSSFVTVNTQMPVTINELSVSHVSVTAEAPVTVNASNNGGFVYVDNQSTTTVNANATNTVEIGQNIGSGSVTITDAGTLVLGAGGNVLVGNGGTVSAFTAGVSILTPTVPTALTIDDSGDQAFKIFTVNATSIVGLENRAITFAGVNLASLTIDDGSGGNLVDVAGTPPAGSFVLNCGTGSDNVTVFSTSDPLTVNDQQGNDTVTIGFNGNLQGITAAVKVTNTFGYATLNVDDSADPVPRNVIMGASGTMDTLTGLAPVLISYAAATTRSLIVDGGKGNNNFTIDDTVFTTYPGGTLTQVNTGTGTQAIVQVNDTTGPLAVNLQGHSSLVTIGSATTGLDFVNNSVSVTGSGPGNSPANTLTIDDSNSNAAAGNEYTVAQTFVQRIGKQPINYSNMGLLHILPSKLKSVIAVTNTMPTPGSETIIDAAAQALVSVHGTTGTLALDLGPSSSVIVGGTQSLNNIQGAVYINMNNLSANLLSLELQDATQESLTISRTVTGGTLFQRAGAAPITVNCFVDRFQWSGIGGARTLSVLAPPAATSIFSIGNDTLNLGSAANQVSNFGDITVVAPKNGEGVVNWNDSGQTGPETYSVSLSTGGFEVVTAPGTTVTLGAPAGLFSSPAPGEFELTGGTGGYTVNVTGTMAGTRTVLSKKSGKDTVNVLANTGEVDVYDPDGTDHIFAGSAGSAAGAAGTTPGTLANINGPLNVFGAPGTTLRLDDSGDTQSRKVSATKGVFTGYGAGAISSSGGVKVTVQGDSHGNTYTVQGTAADDPAVINGGAGVNTFNLADAATVQAPLILNGSGHDTLAGPASGARWAITGNNSGSVGSVVFSDIPNLVGAGPDVFALSPAGQVLTIHGSGTGTWLDYTAFPAGNPVTVNLATGSATNVGGGAAGAISNIQNVWGGAGADSLTGNAQGNVLVGGGNTGVVTGGSGRSILVGGGADPLVGHSDSDVLIAGAPGSALNEATLPLVLQEWQRTDIGYGKRLTDLEYGGGLNGTALLTWGTTVIGDAGGATLTGGPGQNWFFANLHTGTKDTITNLMPGEQVNNGDFGAAFSIGATTNTTNGASGNAIATDSAGNVYFGGWFSGTTNVGADSFTTTDGNSGLVAKYTSTHALVWADAFKGSGGSDSNEVEAVATDAAGNVYVDDGFFGTLTVGGVTLTSNSQSGNSFVAKLNSAGVVQWVRQLSSPSLAFVFNNSVAVDGSGNSCVSGDFTGSLTVGSTTLTAAGSSEDGFFAKFDPSGNVLFAKQLGGKGTSAVDSIAVTSAGSILLGGAFTGTVTFGPSTLTAAGQDGFVSRLDGSGHFVWTQPIVDAQTGTFAAAIVADASGNVYVSGPFSGSAKFGAITLPGGPGTSDVFVAKLNSAGTFQWAVQMGNSGDDETNSLAIDAAGNLYTAGFYQGTATFGSTTLTASADFDSFVAKLNNAGVVVWADDMGGPGNASASGVAVDGAGDVYSTGDYGYTDQTTSAFASDFDAGPATYDLTSQDNAGSAYVSEVTQPGAVTFTGLTGLTSASYALRLSGGDIQLVDTASGQVLLSKVLADTTSITIDAASGINTTLAIDFSGGTYTVPVTFKGSTGNNTLVGPNVNTAWTINGTDAGAVGNVSFSGVGNLVGGTAVDVFRMMPNGREASINGGAGGDWLSYAAYTSGVSVDLATGKAAGVTGSVSNIENVMGGSGSDQLTGNSQGNILDGNGGNDVLVAGSGASVLIGGGNGSVTFDGGAGQDIMIPGTTVYDNNFGALDAILAEWQRTDLSYTQRINHLEVGGGFNSNNILVLNQTVLDDGGAPDTMTGGTGMDWFFQFTGDQITNLLPGEQVNNTPPGAANSSPMVEVDTLSNPGGASHSAPATVVPRFTSPRTSAAVSLAQDPAIDNSFDHFIPLVARSQLD
jgi:hypothetical protein